MFLKTIDSNIILKYFSHKTNKLRNIFLLFLFLIQPVFPQWNSNTSLNTKFVVNSKDPINIVSVENQKGGIFVFWEDTRSDNQEVLFQHINETGKVSFRADGRPVSSLNGKKVLPVAVSHNQLSSIVIWKDFTFNETGDLFAQKVFSNGTFDWGANGIQITNNVEISDYSIDKDDVGNIYITYVEKSKTLPAEFILKYHKLNSNGKEIFTSKSIVLAKNFLRKSNTNILTDNKGGAFILWLESKNNRIILNATHADSSGKINWKEKQIQISDESSNVTSFSAVKVNNDNIYVSWQSTSSKRTIGHQLINIKNKSLWNQSLRNVSNLEGNHTNPIVIAENNNLFISWTYEKDNDRNILLQSYDLTGKPLWNKNGIFVVDEKGHQFGQKLILNNKSLYITWIDRRVDSLHANIYTQRFDLNGNFLWNPNGIIVASSKNSEKSYLNIVSDFSDGAIVVFKDKRTNENSIYGQKVFASGVIVSEVLSFSANVVNENILIEWYGVNEQTETDFIVERGTLNEIQDISWNEISILNSKQNSGTNKYEFVDKPNENGTVYYRIKYGDVSNPSFSDVVKVNYFEGSDVIIVAQNIPNPFSDRTKIAFYLPKDETVTIEFFNSRLEKISEFEKQKFQAGENEIEFDATDLYPGIYFYKFKVKDFIEVKKMVVSK